VGGGLVRGDEGAEAHLSLLATRAPDASDPELFTINGQLLWRDNAWEGAGLTLEASQNTDYRPTEGVERGRDVHGWIKASAIN
jgi:hypothetical protein